MYKIYFAGPLFNEAERNFNNQLTLELEKEGFEVFLPQRDGIESINIYPLSITKEEKRKRLFILDRDKILESDIFLFILDGRAPDEGACVELGIAYHQKYAFSKRKMIVGLHSDKRAAFISARAGSSAP